MAKKKEVKVKGKKVDVNKSVNNLFRQFEKSGSCVDVTEKFKKLVKEIKEDGKYNGAWKTLIYMANYNNVVTYLKDIGYIIKEYEYKWSNRDTVIIILGNSTTMKCTIDSDIHGFLANSGKTLQYEDIFNLGEFKKEIKQRYTHEDIINPKNWFKRYIDNIDPVWQRCAYIELYHNTIHYQIGGGSYTLEEIQKLEMSDNPTFKEENNNGK
jgi:hypothetical protein